MKRKDGRKNIKKEVLSRSGSFATPEWMDCVWRRVSCNKKTCPICCVHDEVDTEDFASFAELWKLLENEEGVEKGTVARISRRVRESGFSLEKVSTDNFRLPHPDEFPFYRKVRSWQRSVFVIMNEAQDLGYLWPYSESAANLFWYANILLSKVYLQLVSHASIGKGVSKKDSDHNYTQYVLGECVGEIKQSLHDLAYLSSEQKAELMLSLSCITKLEYDIKKL